MAQHVFYSWRVQKGLTMCVRTARSDVVGVTFSNADGTDRQRIIRQFCQTGMPLEARLEPCDSRSGYAIGLWIRGRRLIVIPARYKIGYVREQLAGELRQDIDRGCEIAVRIQEVFGGGGLRRTYGVHIEIKSIDPWAPCGDRPSRPGEVGLKRSPDHRGEWLWDRQLDG
jgi:hypothetical protein